MRLLFRYGLAPILGAFGFSVGFLLSAGVAFLNGDLPIAEVVLGFLITSFTGFVVGAGYGFYRPLLRKLGRHLGDALTGAVTLNLVVLVFYALSFYLPIERFNPKDPVAFVTIFTGIGALGGWLVNITKSENEFRDWVVNEIDHNEDNDQIQSDGK